MYYINYYKNKLKFHAKLLLGRLPSASRDVRNVAILNPQIGSENIGDEVIWESVKSHLYPIHEDSFLTIYPSRFINDFDLKTSLAKNDKVYICGTNLLSSNMDVRNQLAFDPVHMEILHERCVLMGVGWWQYQGKPNKYTRNLIQSILCKESLHSTRDVYTLEMLRECGINNTIYTSCPTLWDIDNISLSKIKLKKSNHVVTTLTSYNPDPFNDAKIINYLNQQYDTVYLFPQGQGDKHYFTSLNILHPESIQILSPSLKAYDTLLEEGDVDYAGSRLHGGIRALQKNVRTVIIAVDNRAAEISRHTNLPVVSRADLEGLKNFCNSPKKIKIDMPNKGIREWKKSNSQHEGSLGS